jgi:hypothetical protein
MDRAFNADADQAQPAQALRSTSHTGPAAASPRRRLPAARRKPLAPFLPLPIERASCAIEHSASSEQELLAVSQIVNFCAQGPQPFFIRSSL